MLFQIVLMITMFANIGSGNNPDVSLLLNYFMFFPIIMILIVATQFGWFWSVGIGLQSKVPENVKMKTKKFKIFYRKIKLHPLKLLLSSDRKSSACFHTNVQTALLKLRPLLYRLQLLVMYRIPPKK